MSPLATWIVIVGVFIVGLCIGVGFTAWFLDEEGLDDVELRD